MQTIEVQELKKRIDNGEEVHLVDVREPDENKAFNIGGTLLPLGQVLSLQIDAIEDLKDKEIICYCRSGQRSMQASLMLETMGFQNVKNLTGGMNEWQSAFPQAS